jgi:hypothetical protein
MVVYRKILAPLLILLVLAASLAVLVFLGTRIAGCAGNAFVASQESGSVIQQ